MHVTRDTTVKVRIGYQYINGKSLRCCVDSLCTLEGDWYSKSNMCSSGRLLTYSAWQEERLKLKEDERKDNFIISFLKSPFVDSNVETILKKLWKRICTLCLTVIVFVMIRLHVMGWTTPGGVRAFSQFDNPLAHTEDRMSRVLTGWYLAARHVWHCSGPFNPCVIGLWIPYAVTTTSSQKRMNILLSFLITLIVYLVWILTFSSVSTINREIYSTPSACIWRRNSIRFAENAPVALIINEYNERKDGKKTL